MSGLVLEGVAVDIGRRRVLEPTTIDLPAGRVTGIIGPNGAGKSTLLKAIVGVRAHSGQVRRDGRPLPPAGTSARARTLGYLPQGHEAHWPITVARAVALGRFPHLPPWRRLERGDRDVIDAAMEDADVVHLADARVTDLSGGERARVMLARMLAVGAPVLLVDEPVAALDPAHQIAIMARLRAEATRRGRAVAVVLHDLTLAARYCDRLVLFAAGRLVKADATDALLAAPELEARYGVRFGFAEIEGARVVVPLAADG